MPADYIPITNSCKWSCLEDGKVVVVVDVWRGIEIRNAKQLSESLDRRHRRVVLLLA